MDAEPTNPAARQLTITWDDPTPNMARAATMTGLEYMRAIIAREMIPAPFARLLNFYLAEVEEGYAVFKGTPGEQHFNPLNTVHGGFAATLLDSATGCAVHTTLPVGKLYGTAQLNVNLTRPILPSVGLLICEGRVIHRGSRVSTAEATLKDERGKLYAHGTATCYIFEMSEGGGR